MKKVIEIIKKHRNRLKLTQTEMGEKLEMTQPNYAKFENGKGEITLSRLEKLAEIFNISVGELLGLENVEDKSPTHTAGEGADIQALQKEIQDLKKENDNLKKNTGLLEEISKLKEKEYENLKQKIEVRLTIDIENFLLFNYRIKYEEQKKTIKEHIKYQFDIRIFLVFLIKTLNLFGYDEEKIDVFYENMFKLLLNFCKRYFIQELESSGYLPIENTQEMEYSLLILFRKELYHKVVTDWILSPPILEEILLEFKKRNQGKNFFNP